jgi:hypothetical protein
MDAVWKKWFPNNPPARTVVPYSGLGGKGWRFEVTMDLLTNDSKLTPEIIHTDKAATPFGHEPQAVKVGNLLFFSTLRSVNSSGIVTTTPPQGFGRYVDQGSMRGADLDAFGLAPETKLLLGMGLGALTGSLVAGSLLGALFAQPGARKWFHAADSSDDGLNAPGRPRPTRPVGVRARWPLSRREPRP